MITHAKNGISAMELKRQLGVSYPTSWKIKHKLMEAMKDRDGRYLLRGIVHIDDAYFGGELMEARLDGVQRIRFPSLQPWK